MIDMHASRPTSRLLITIVARVLLASAGAFLVVKGFPVAVASWISLAAEPPLDDMRFGRLPPAGEVLSAISVLERAIEWEDTARRRADLAALFIVNATRRDLSIVDEERLARLSKAERHLVVALARVPGDATSWFRLAVVREALYGIDDRVTKALVMSIRTAPVAPRLWSARLELILRSVSQLSAEQLAATSEHVALIWRGSANRTLFALAINAQGGELFVRYALRNIDGAQEELSRLLQPARDR